LDPSGAVIVVERMLEEGRQEIRSPMPAVISVVKEINEPRYPSFMGIRKASKAEIPVWSLADLDAGDLPSPATESVEVYEPPKIDTTCEFIEADSTAEIAAQLVNRLIEEKVI
jgi:electron transfer flavoprotein beta subunit